MVFLRPCHCCLSRENICKAQSHYNTMYVADKTSERPRLLCHLYTHLFFLSSFLRQSVVQQIMTPCCFPQNRKSTKLYLFIGVKEGKGKRCNAAQFYAATLSQLKHSKYLYFVAPIHHKSVQEKLHFSCKKSYLGTNTVNVFLGCFCNCQPNPHEFTKQVATASPHGYTRLILNLHELTKPRTSWRLNDDQKEK